VCVCVCSVVVTLCSLSVTCSVLHRKHGMHMIKSSYVVHLQSLRLIQMCVLQKVYIHVILLNGKVSKHKRKYAIHTQWASVTSDGLQHRSWNFYVPKVSYIHFLVSANPGGRVSRFSYQVGRTHNASRLWCTAHSYLTILYNRPKRPQYQGLRYLGVWVDT
jgi:hypothetical protein